MIIIKNKLFTLKLSEDCIAKSLVLNSTGEECLIQTEDIPFFSLTQDRPYNNEIKLIYQNKKTIFQANRVHKDGNKLIVGFELLEIEAVVDIDVKDNYISFTLTDFIVPETAYGVGCLCISPPPVSAFRLIQLPVKKRERYGDWINVVWDNNVCVDVLSTSPYAIVDSEIKKDSCVMYADALSEIKLKNCSAALIVSSPDEFLNCIDSVEKDYDLPRGVESRRSADMSASIYWTWDINLSNVDEHIKNAQKGGFRRILIYYPAFFKETGYTYTGDYDFNEKYPNGIEDLKLLLEKIKSAGIVPGIHFLHSHIGINSRYVTPVADHRLNLTKRFTLSKPVEKDDSVIYVEQNPEGSPLNSKLQVLKVDGEIIHYDSYSTEYPFSFNRCTRGYYDTNVTSHNMGTTCGILDVSEFCAESVYIDQTTSLQDEVAQKIANAYNAGFEFIYFDGSEGTNPPFEFNIPYAQYKVYSKLDKKPIFCEGAAKAHFGWHMLSGGNAFDVFPPNVFKEKIAEFPLNAAPKMVNNFTRINFGWWEFNKDIQPDMYEYGTSKAASYNCPVTVQFDLNTISDNPRIDDVLEVMYRWEDVRKKNWLSDEQKELLKNPEQEYILLLNEKNDYELVPYYHIKKAAHGNNLLSSFYFDYNDKAYVVCWHTEGSGRLFLPLNTDDFEYEEQLGKKSVSVEKTKDGIIIPVSKRMYFSSDITKEKLIEAFENSNFID